MIQEIDPRWAWSPYTPDRERPWNRARAAHLFRRAGFAATSRELDEAVAREPADVVRGLFEEEPEGFAKEMEEMGRTLAGGGNPRSLSAWWLHRILATRRPLREKLTLFWHGHFATSADKVKDAHLMLEQHLLLRRHALGDFSAMVQEISRDPAMLIYLDSATNRKAHPNENYARELMELFCLGEGRYTERDIREIARCFTGWEVRRRRFHFNRHQHDEGTKAFLGSRGAFGGEDAVRIVLEQPSAPEFIARKLFRYFVFEEPEPPDALIEPLARDLREGFRIAPLVERILRSNIFFSSHAIGRRVRSPVEFAAGLLRALEGSTDTRALAEDLDGLGQALFYPPSVKGWDGGRAWINSSTLLGRANAVRRLLDHPNTRFGGGTLEEFLAKEMPPSPAERVDRLLGLLVAVPVPADIRERLVALAGRRPADAVHALCALPEFQLC